MVGLRIGSSLSQKTLVGLDDKGFTERSLNLAGSPASGVVHYEGNMVIVHNAIDGQVAVLKVLSS